MKYRDIRAVIVLFAGLIALIANMRLGKPVIVSLIIVLIVILIFYIIGTLVIEILQKNLEQNDIMDDMENSNISEEGTEDVLEEEEVGETSAQVSFDDDEDE